MIDDQFGITLAYRDNFKKMMSGEEAIFSQEKEFWIKVRGQLKTNRNEEILRVKKEKLKISSFFRTPTNGACSAETEHRLWFVILKNGATPKMTFSGHNPIAKYQNYCRKKGVSGWGVFWCCQAKINRYTCSTWRG